MVEGRSCVEFAVVETKEEAFLDSQAFHNRLKRHSDALNGLTQTSQVRLVHNFVVDCRTVGLKVFVDAPRRKVQNLVDGTRQGMEVGLMKAERNCAHKEMQYSAKRDAAAVVLDP